MTKRTKFVAAGAALMLGATTLFAGSIDAKSNLSTGYLRNPSRNTEDSRPEAALYNLAGTGFLKQKFSAEVGNQFVFKEYSHKASDAATQSVIGTSTYKDEKPVILYPNVDMVYRFGDFAVSASFHIAAGGGSLDYKKGTGLTKALFLGAAQRQAAAGNSAAAVALQAIAGDSHELEVTSVTYGETIGLAYNWNDTLSVAAGIRFLEATQSMTLSSDNAYWTGAINGQSDAGYDAFGWGVGGIFGVHYKPISKLDLTLQYKTITKMRMEFTDVQGSALSAMLGIAEGDKFDNDLPSELNTGIGYQLLDSLYLSTSFNYYFNSHADVSSAFSPDKNIDWDDSWEIACGADWQLSPKVLLSTGTLYSRQGSQDDVNNALSPVLDSLSFAVGVEYQAMKQLTITYGAMYTLYKEADYTASGITFELDKTVFQMALSATYAY
ncbi:MAG: outer membrane protein transport protein [Sphaerochaetaceae bacterium]|nr:outer membrane protein transport protein [Spirochaetales bacterium]MDY5498876.1 outer membrane protein transport protein [Sphaerochaetaceae bacterium]